MFTIPPIGAAGPDYASDVNEALEKTKVHLEDLGANVKAIFGAAGDGVEDDASSLNDGTLNAPTRRLWVPPSVYGAGTTVDLQSKSHFEGEWSALVDTDARPPTEGTVLKWLGGAGGTVLRAMNTEYASAKGFHIWFPASGAGNTGLLIDSDNTPPTHDLLFEEFTITDCLGAGAVAIRVGSALSSYQIDSWALRHFRLHVCQNGIEINSANGGDDSLIEMGTLIGIQEVGLLCNRVKTLTVLSTAFGGMDEDSIAVKIIGDHTAVTFQSCDMEMAGGGKCIVIDGPPGTYVGPVTLIGCELSGDIDVITDNQVVILIGGEVFSDINISGTLAKVINIGCRVLGTVTVTGAGAAYQDLAARASSKTVWDPGSIAAGEVVTTAVAMTSVAGDHAVATFDQMLNGLEISATAFNNAVAVYMRNNTAGPLDPASGNLRIVVVPTIP